MIWMFLAIETLFQNELVFEMTKFIVWVMVSSVANDFQNDREKFNLIVITVDEEHSWRLKNVLPGCLIPRNVVIPR